jgi:hypothetical protein
MAGGIPAIPVLLGFRADHDFLISVKFVVRQLPAHVQSCTVVASAVLYVSTTMVHHDVSLQRAARRVGSACSLYHDKHK